MLLSIQIRTFSLILLSGLFCLTTHGASSDDFAIYPTANRPAEELVQIVDGMHSERVRIRAMDSKVVIYGPPKEIPAIVELLRSLDRKARMYRVYVRVVSNAEREQQQTAVTGAVGGKSVYVSKRSRVSSSGGGANATVGGVNITAASENQLAQSGGTQTILLTEGSESEVGSGSSANLNSFFVKLRSVGNGGVHLNVRQNQANGRGSQKLLSEVDAKLGQWHLLGELISNERNQDSEILGKGEAQAVTRHTIQVKVEAVEGCGP